MIRTPQKRRSQVEHLERRCLLSGVPSTPSGLVAKVASDTVVDLVWDRVGTGESSITVWRSASGGAFSPLSVLPAGSDIYVDNSCYAATSYRYEVTADNASGSSAPTSPVSATTQASGAGLSNKPTVTASATSATSVQLSWAGANTVDNWFVEQSTNGGAYSIITTVGDASGTLTYTALPLSPSTTYSYRMRLVSGSAYGNYTNAVSVTTPARTAGLPIEPSGLTGAVNSGNSIALSWTDPNAGSASYRIETSPFSWTTPQWTEVAQTAVGATSYTLTTTPQTLYYVRVRAANASGNSGYTAQIVVRSASAGTGSPKLYTIGPGKQYATLGALNWSQLGPGDTVEIFPNKNSSGTIIPYYEKPMISVRGTATAPITITGMADPATGQLPIIDGTNAVTNAQGSVHYQPLEDTSLVLIGNTATEQTNSAGWSPGYLTISNLEIRNAYQGSYTGFDGASHSYNNPYGIYIEKGDHITIQGCSIHDNGGGVFGAGQGDSRNLEQITLQSNSIYGNGVVGDYLEHNTYLEGIDTVYQYNTYGPLRSGSPGAGLKDRGAGTLIRYNFFEGGGHLVNIDEAENYAGQTLTMASYNQADVYGNVLYNTNNQSNGAAALPVYFGIDGMPSPYDRNGVLYFYNNTFINQVDQSTFYRLNLFDLPETSDVVDARNNIIDSIPMTTGGAAPEIDLLPGFGVGYLGTNWITQGWNAARPDQSFTGYLGGTANVISNAQNNPGFVSLASQNFQLTSGSQCLGQQGVLPTDAPPILAQYVGPLMAGQAVSSVTNLGAFQQGAAATVPAAPSGLNAAPVDPVSIQLTWTNNASNATSILIERSTDGTNFTQITSANATTTAYTDSGLTSGLTYTYRVRAANAVGDSTYSNTASAIAPAAPVPPAAPSNLSAAPGTYGQINLTWTDNANNETAFLIERSTDGVNFSQVASANANATNYADNGLNSSTTYTYRVRATNSAGNSNYSNIANTTTGAIAAGPYSLFTPTDVPVVAADPDTSATELGIRFESDVAGYIEGIRFYKASTNVGTHSGHLWTDTGTLLATATFTNESASGWQTVTFLQPVLIQPNIIYLASYFAPGGHYADDMGGLSRSIDSAPLHAPADAVNGPNGAYSYGPSGTFPTQGYLASNYWVDVVFQPQLPTLDVVTITGGNAVTLTQDPDRIHIDWTMGTTTAQLPINDPNGLTIHGDGGSDSIILTTVNGDPLPNTIHLRGTFSISGLAGTNPLANTTLEIGRSTVYISYSSPASDPLSSIRGYLYNGYNHGLWTGVASGATGVITSTDAAANSNRTTGIGYADSAEGIVSIAANTIELKYTLYGDTGLTGAVGFTDFMRLTQRFTTTSNATWDQGDFNYDGAINSSDFNLLQPNFLQTLGAQADLPPAAAGTALERSSRVVASSLKPPPVLIATGPVTPTATVTKVAAYRHKKQHGIEKRH